MHIADILKANIAGIKNERAARAALEARLRSDVIAAVELMRETVRGMGLEGIQVSATIGHTDRWQEVEGAEVADGKDIRIMAAKRRLADGRSGHELITVRWRPARASADDDDYESVEGWAATDCTSDRFTTAVEAVQTAVARPATGRRLAETLIGLGA